jgi:hypothetical protein
MVIITTMMRTFYSLLLLICLTSTSLAQMNDTNYGMVITKITTDGSSRDTTKLLYCRTISGSLLSVYTIEGGRVLAGMAYSIKAANTGFYFYARTTRSGELATDSLRIDFKDAEQAVLINKHDRYMLYPKYYKTFKQEIASKHSVIALLNLLEDAIGDYPIAEALPLISYAPQVDKQIRRIPGPVLIIITNEESLLKSAPRTVNLSALVKRSLIAGQILLISNAI